MPNGNRHVVIVGGGFAGLGCAQELADHEDISVTLIDRNNYHQFQPLLYQVATSQLAGTDIAHSLRDVFADQHERRHQAGRHRGGRRHDPDRDRDRRRAVDRRRAGAGGGLAAQLLPHPGRGREHVPALLARQRDQAAFADPGSVRAGRPRPLAGRSRRAQHRGRRRRPDRRRGGGRACRHDLRHRSGRVPQHRRHQSARSTCSTSATRC